MFTYLIFIKNGSGKYVTNASIPIVVYHDEEKDEEFWEHFFIKSFVRGCYYEMKMDKEDSHCCSQAPQWADYCPSCGGRIKRNLSRFVDYVTHTWHRLFSGINVDDFSMHLWDYLEDCGWQFYIGQFDFKTVHKTFHLEGISYKLDNVDVIKPIFEEIEAEDQQN